MMRLLLALALCLAWATEPAKAMEIKRSDLIGSWVYVSTYSEFVDGSKQNMFGTRPQGVFVIMENGYYSHIIMRPDLPKVKAGRIRDMTLSEAETIAEGVLAHFGTYIVDEKAGTFTATVWKSSFPNLDGQTQVRTVVKLDRENLSYINDLSVADKGARVVALLRRLPDK